MEVVRTCAVMQKVPHFLTSPQVLQLLLLSLNSIDRADASIRPVRVSLV